MSVEVGGVVRSVDGSVDDELLATLIFFAATLLSVSGSLASSCSSDARARLGAPRVGEGDLEKGSGTA